MQDAQIHDLATLTLQMDNKVAWVHLLDTLIKLVPKSEAYSLRERVWAVRCSLQAKAKAERVRPPVPSAAPDQEHARAYAQAMGIDLPKPEQQNIGPMIGPGMPGQVWGPRSVGLSMNVGQGFNGQPGIKRGR